MKPNGPTNGRLEDRYVINAVLGAAKILEAFTLESPSLTNAELAKKLGIHKSTITRLMQSLIKAELDKRDKKSGRYSLTHKLCQIGNVYVKNSDLHTEGRPLLESLSDRFNENAQMGVLGKAEWIIPTRSKRNCTLWSTRPRRLPCGRDILKNEKTRINDKLDAFEAIAIPCFD